MPILHASQRQLKEERGCERDLDLERPGRPGEKSCQEAVISLNVHILDTPSLFTTNQDHANTTLHSSSDPTMLSLGREKTDKNDTNTHARRNARTPRGNFNHAKATLEKGGAREDLVASLLVHGVDLRLVLLENDLPVQLLRGRGKALTQSH